MLVRKRHCLISIILSSYLAHAIDFERALKKVLSVFGLNKLKQKQVNALLVLLLLSHSVLR